MPNLALTGEEMLAWNEASANSWRKLTEEHPEILALPCDIYSGVQTVGQLLQHIVAVETRYADRLAGTAATSYDGIPFGSSSEVFEAHDAAVAGFRAELAKDIDWNEAMEFPTLTMGRVRASRKTIFFHAMLHSIRHYAQLGTLVRKHGFKPDRPMDYVVMGLERLN